MSDIQDAETAQLLSQFSGPVTITPMQAAYPGAEPFADNGLAGFADFDAWNGQSVDGTQLNASQMLHSDGIDFSAIQPAEPEEPAVEQRQVVRPQTPGLN